MADGIETDALSTVRIRLKASPCCRCRSANSRTIRTKRTQKSLTCRGWRKKRAAQESEAEVPLFCMGILQRMPKRTPEPLSDRAEIDQRTRLHADTTKADDVRPCPDKLHAASGQRLAFGSTGLRDAMANGADWSRHEMAPLHPRIRTLQPE